MARGQAAHRLYMRRIQTPRPPRRDRTTVHTQHKTPEMHQVNPALTHAVHNAAHENYNQSWPQDGTRAGGAQPATHATPSPRVDRPPNHTAIHTQQNTLAFQIHRATVLVCCDQ